jgi:GNAT superfamily N-acetyltransferase
MVIRDIHWQTDKEQLTKFDASFSTDSIYRVRLNGMSAQMSEEKLPAPFQKTYPLDVENDIHEATFSAVAEINGVISGFVTAKYEAWNKRITLTGLYVLQASRKQGVGKALVNAVLDYMKTTPARCCG